MNLEPFARTTIKVLVRALDKNEKKQIWRKKEHHESVTWNDIDEMNGTTSQNQMKQKWKKVKTHTKTKKILYYSKCIIINHRNTYSTLQKYIYINVLKTKIFSVLFIWHLQLEFRRNDGSESTIFDWLR